jgi:hypothetical protein
MSGFEWRSVLDKFAPVMSAALGGPLANSAMKAIVSVVLPGEDYTDENIGNKLNYVMSNLEDKDISRLKEMEKYFDLEVGKLKINKRQNTLRKGDGAKTLQRITLSFMPAILALLLTIGFFSVLATLMLTSVLHESKDILYIMLGSLGTAWTGAIQFYFGSTKTSDDKNVDLIRKV